MPQGRIVETLHRASHLAKTRNPHLGSQTPVNARRQFVAAPVPSQSIQRRPTLFHSLLHPTLNLDPLLLFLRTEVVLRLTGTVLPLWFLVLALVLPRVTLFLAWYEHFRFPLPFPVDVVFWVFVPRLLVLYMIYLRQGLDIWFAIHLIVAIGVYAAGTHRISNR
jgi:hypothetical protein